jgi:hypothetical protein
MAKRITDLGPHERELLTAGMTWADHFWDEKAGLLWAPGDVADVQHAAKSGMHTVRDTTWYALGLLVRNGPGDAARAARALEAILSYQFDEPGQVYHGTFYRAPEEAHPPAPALEWMHYDPNWREFIMTTIFVALAEYEDRLPATLVRKIDAAIPRAVDGALARGLKAAYTNIAVMNAFMLWFAGVRQHRPEWVAAGEDMAREVYRLFKLHETFEEYNSPTYYGVDIHALALWRAYSTSPVLRGPGAEMEALLWTDIARYYHAGLRNVAGPYNRSYGMDMRRYVAVLGECMWMATGKERAPFPDLARPFAHAHDFLFAPALAVVGVQVPAEAQAHFMAFQGERQVERIISDAPRRVATAWIGNELIIGAEAGNPRRGYVQLHPATLHWRVGANEVGWLRLVHSEPVDCRAGKNRLDVSGKGEIAFQICAPGLRAGDIAATRWQLPGLTLRVETSVQEIHVADAGQWWVVRYLAAPEQPVALTLRCRQ